MWLYHWVPQHHQGRQGGRIAANTLAYWVSALACCFERMFPDSGNWDAHSSRGNPVHSSAVRNAVELYRREQNTRGTRERSAVPMTATEYGALMAALDTQITSA